MPSPKSKKHRRRQQPKPLESLEKKLQRGPFRDQKLIVEPSGKAKMSDVLEKFVEPYSEFADTKEAYQKLLTLGVMAWNASFLPKEKRQDMIDTVFDEGLPDAPRGLTTELKEIVRMLIARKEAYFSEYRRNIIDFELTDTDEGYHLSVASTLEDVPPVP